MNKISVLKQQTSQSGFTLIEMMITVAIIGILAAIALPSYENYVKRGKAAEATATLAGLKVQMEQYFQDYRTYANTGAVVAPCAPPTPSQYFIYSCTVQTATTFTIRAAGIGGQQRMGNFTFTINQDNGKTSQYDGTVGATCWLSNKGGTC